MAASYQEAVSELVESLNGRGEPSEAGMEAVTSRLHARVRVEYPTLVATAEDLSQDALVRPGGAIDDSDGFMRAVATGRVDSQSARLTCHQGQSNSMTLEMSGKRLAATGSGRFDVQLGYEGHAIKR